MFRAPPRPSSGAYNSINSLWFHRWSVGGSSVVGHGLVKQFHLVGWFIWIVWWCTGLPMSNLTFSICDQPCTKFDVCKPACDNMLPGQCYSTVTWLWSSHGMEFGRWTLKEIGETCFAVTLSTTNLICIHLGWHLRNEALTYDHLDYGVVTWVMS